MLNFVQDYETLQKFKAHPVTPINSRKKGAIHGSSESLNLNELVEGEQSSTRLRCKHVKMEKK